MRTVTYTCQQGRRTCVEIVPRVRLDHSSYCVIVSIGIVGFWMSASSYVNHCCCYINYHTIVVQFVHVLVIVLACITQIQPGCDVTKVKVCCYTCAVDVCQLAMQKSGLF